MPKLIAFCGNGRYAGKDAAADFVQEFCKATDQSFERLAFARIGKELIARSFGLSADDIRTIDRFKVDGGVSIEVTEGQGTHIVGRDYIINVMEGVRSLFGEDFWTLQILPHGWTPKADVTVITDLRFPPEANRVAECGGLTIEVQRPNAETGQSEGVLDNLYVDAVLPNHGSLDDLKTNVFNMMTQLATATS